MLKAIAEFSDSDRVFLFKRLKRELSPLCADKFENFNHGMAKARCARLLHNAGYRVQPEKSMPCNDIIEPTYVHQFRLDVYGELYPKVPANSAIWTSDPTLLEWKPIDVIVIEIGGLSGLDGTQHGKNRKFANRTKHKREMVCSQYNIPLDRFYLLEKDEVFSMRYMLSDAELLEKLNLR